MRAAPRTSAVAVVSARPSLESPRWGNLVKFVRATHAPLLSLYVKVVKVVKVVRVMKVVKVVKVNSALTAGVIVYEQRVILLDTIEHLRHLALSCVAGTAHPLLAHVARDCSRRGVLLAAFCLVCANLTLARPFLPVLAQSCLGCLFGGGRLGYRIAGGAGHAVFQGKAKAGCSWQCYYQAEFGGAGVASKRRKKG